MSHLILMAFHALLVGVFFAFLVRDGATERWRVFLTVFLGMLLGALTLAWFMYPYPIQGPPA